MEETRLPGVGVRFAFTTAGGERLGVIAHRSGKRELLVYDRGDPDACDAVIGLGEDDTRTLVDLLGGSEVTERIGAAIRQSLDGLELEWVELGAQAPGVGRPISELGLRSAPGPRSWRSSGARRRSSRRARTSRCRAVTSPSSSARTRRSAKQ